MDSSIVQYNNHLDALYKRYAFLKSCQSDDLNSKKNLAKEKSSLLNEIEIKQDALINLLSKS